MCNMRALYMKVSMNFRIADMTIALLGRLCKDWLLCVKRVMRSECRSIVDGWMQFLNPFMCTRLILWGAELMETLIKALGIISALGIIKLYQLQPALLQSVQQPWWHWVHTTWWAQGPSQFWPQSQVIYSDSKCDMWFWRVFFGPAEACNFKGHPCHDCISDHFAKLDCWQLRSVHLAKRACIPLKGTTQGSIDWWAVEHG